MVNMELVTVFPVRTVRLDARQAHGAAGAVRAFPMIEIRRHGDALSLITLPPLMVNAFRDASFLIKAHDRQKTLRIFVVAQLRSAFVEWSRASRRPHLPPHTERLIHVNADTAKWMIIGLHDA